MSLIPSAITGAIISAGAGIFPGSLHLPKIATAVGLAIPAWISLPTNVLVFGATAGTTGTGTVQGKMFCIPSGQVPASLAAAGLLGVNAARLGAAVETGVASSFNTLAQYSGFSTGVSAGTDVSKVVSSNAATLIPILLANLIGVAIAGITAPQLAAGLGNGISLLVFTATGLGGVIPISAGPAPGFGTSNSVVF